LIRVCSHTAALKTDSSSLRGERKSVFASSLLLLGRAA
jgi:hypothetical protein